MMIAFALLVLGVGAFWGAYKEKQKGPVNEILIIEHPPQALLPPSIPEVPGVPAVPEIQPVPPPRPPTPEAHQTQSQAGLHSFMSKLLARRTALSQQKIASLQKRLARHRELSDQERVAIQEEIDRLVQEQAGLKAALEAMGSREIRTILSSIDPNKDTLSEIEKELKRMKINVDLGTHQDAVQK